VVKKIDHTVEQSEVIPIAAACRFLIPDNGLGSMTRSAPQAHLKSCVCAGRGGIAASGLLRNVSVRDASYFGAVGEGAAGVGDVGAGAAPVVPDGAMMPATRLSFGSINRISLVSSFTYWRSLAPGT